MTSTTTMKAGTNGQARKSLAEQIDRLDSMLDGLADGLNDAVAAAVKEAVGVAVKEAIQAVLCEALANPELVTRLVGVAPPAQQPATKAAKPKVSWKQRWAAGCKATLAKLNAARVWCVRRLESLRNGYAGLWRQARLLACYRNQLLIAVGVGMTVAAAAYVAGPWLAAAFSGVGGFAAAVAVQAGLWLRRTIGASTCTNA